MTDPIERELRNLLDERARGDADAVQRLADGIDAFPRRSRLGLAVLRPIAAASVVVIAIVLAAPRLMGTAAGPTPTPTSVRAHRAVPCCREARRPSPAIRGWLAATAFRPICSTSSSWSTPATTTPISRRCFALPSSTSTLRHSSSCTFLVLVAPAITGNSHQQVPLPTNQPGHRDVCVLVEGQDPNLYGDVDVSGLTVDVVPSSPAPSSSADSQPPSATATTTPVPSLSADAATALDVATRYETARARGQWPDAWALLSAQSQAQVGSEPAFMANEAAYNASGGTVFSIQAPTQDPDLEANFLGAMAQEIAAVADANRGYLIFIQHPDVQAASAGTTGLFIAPLISGEWRIWLVH